MTDSELRTLLRTAPKEGRAALFSEYYGLVYAIVFRRLRSIGSREDVEECVSDVFADIFRSYDTGSAYDGDLRGYVGTVAARRAVDAYRMLSRSAGREIPLEHIEAQPDAVRIEEQAESAEEGRILLACIEELGEPDASILIRRYYYGCTAGEIARALSMQPGTVRMRCSRALKRLRTRLREFGIEA